MRATDYLDQGAAAMRDRASQRDCPDGERSMKRTVAIFQAYTDIELTEKQGWQFMMCLKMARGAQGEHCDDDYTDGCAYTALAAEASAVEPGVVVSAPEEKDLNAGRRHPLSTGN